MIDRLMYKFYKQKYDSYTYRIDCSHFSFEDFLTIVCNKKKEKTRLVKFISSVLKLKLDINDFYF